MEKPERQPYIHWTTCYDYRGDEEYRAVLLQVRKFIPMPQAMKIPAAKAAVDKEWENLRKFRRGT